MSERGISAVVIGRNEGKRLLACLASVQPEVDRVVYVDSGSSDGSAEAAQSTGAVVVVLDKGPFTAARGRQAGLDVLREKGLVTEFVLFIDGDCTLQPGFVAAAMAHMRDHSKAGAVAGRRREAGSGFWSRLIDIEWDTPVGPTDGVGGDSLMRWRAIEEAGGWPVTVIAGEEPDLCLRMKDAGWECYRLPVEMTLHDIRMTRFGQYWKRCVRAGHAYAEVAWRRRKGHHADRARAVASMLLYAAVMPGLILFAAVVWWPAVLVLCLAYIRLVAAVAARTRRAGRSLGLSLAYACFTLLGKFAGLLGVLRYVFGMVTGRRSGIIEYNAPSQRPSASGAAS